MSLRKPQETCILLGAPMDCGKRRAGCLMGPDALRTAGISQVLADLGHGVEDRGNLTPAAHAAARPAPECRNPAVHSLGETLAWTEVLRREGRAAFDLGTPIFMGGDHAMALGTLAAAADHAALQNRPLFVLWLDAHTDIHTLQTTSSGNLHGTPVAYALGLEGFDGFPEMPRILGKNICYIGLRSVDPEERAAVHAHGPTAIDMRAIDEFGLSRPLENFLAKVRAANGLLHVSLDVDFLDPSVAPAVGTTVPGGATVREAHLVMEMLSDSGCLTSLDLVELNPFLDERGRTAELMVDLTASLFGRRVFDRETTRY